MSDYKQKYRLTKKLDALGQLSLARKLAPAIASIEILLADENKDKDSVILIILILSQLPEDSYNFVVRSCLELVLRIQDDGKGAKLFNNGMLMFEDTSLTDITNLVAWVIEENLGDFIGTALSGLKANQSTSPITSQ